MLTEEIITLLAYLSVSDYCACAEWVEISQNNYRQGFKPHNPPPPTGPAVSELKPTFDRVVGMDFGDIQQYSNASIPTWRKRNKPKIKHKIIGNVERVTTGRPRTVDEKFSDELKKSDKEKFKTNIQDETVSDSSSKTTVNIGDKVTLHKEETTNIAVVNEDEQAKAILQGRVAVERNRSVAKPDPNILKTEQYLNTSTGNPELEDMKKEDANDKESPTLQNKSEQFNTLDGIIKVLKLVQDTISKNSHRALNSKTKYLRELRDSIMLNIEDRMEALWASDEADTRAPSPGRSRVGRSIGTSKGGGGQVDFPSAESALMSISFLTFAVFLIKLVMQVIQTYKTKAMMVTPVFAAMGRDRGPDIAGRKIV